MKRISVGRIVRRRWMLLVAVAVVAVAGFARVSAARHLRLARQHVNRQRRIRTTSSRSTPSTWSSRSSARRARWQPSTTWTSTRNRSDADDVALPWTYDDHHHRARGLRQRCGPRRQRLHRLPHHHRRRGQGREIGQHRERLHLLPGQVRMSNHHLPRVSVARMIRRLSVPIALFWLALAVVTNVFVPQLETVAQAHNVSLSPQDAPSLQASKRIGKVFHEFDSDSAAMIVLEGDQPLGADAHHYYDGLIREALPGHEARAAHSGFLGGSADGGGLAERRRQGGIGAGVSRRQSGRVVVQSVRRFGARHRGPHAAAAGGQGLCHRRRAAGHRSVRGGQQRHPEGHPDHYRGDRNDAVFRLPLASPR